MAPALPAAVPALGAMLMSTIGGMAAGSMMAPKMPAPPAGPGEPPDPAVMPDPENVLLKKKKQRAAATQLQGGGTVLSGETLGGGY